MRSSPGRERLVHVRSAQRHASYAFILPIVVFALLGAAACSWNLDYLDSGKDAGVRTDDGSLLDATAVDVAQVDATQGEEEGSDGGVPVEARSSEEADLGDGGNLIVNPSCEDGTLEWGTLSGTPIESSTVFVRSGDAHSCRSYNRIDTVSSTSVSSYDGPAQDITTVVVPGHEYSVSVWALWASPPSNGGLDSGASDDSGARSGDSGAYGPQELDITVREICGGNSTYVRLAGTNGGVPEAQWTFLSSNSTPLAVPTNCTSTFDVEVYVEGPDIGLDVYVDELRLLLVN